MAVGLTNLCDRMSVVQETGHYEEIESNTRTRDDAMRCTSLFDDDGCGGSSWKPMGGCIRKEAGMPTLYTGEGGMAQYL